MFFCFWFHTFVPKAASNPLLIETYYRWVVVFHAGWRMNGEALPGFLRPLQFGHLFLVFDKLLVHLGGEPLVALQDLPELIQETPPAPPSQFARQ